MGADDHGTLAPTRDWDRPEDALPSFTRTRPWASSCEAELAAFPKLRRSRDETVNFSDGFDSAEHRPDPDAEISSPAGKAERILKSSGTTKSALSSYNHVLRGQLHVGAGDKVRERSRDRRLDPLGITVLHEPESSPVADIVFVHGLGGTSRQTWSKNKDPQLFWPLEWLPFEPTLSGARICTFGYNAHFSSTSDASTILNISDFAKDLLYQLRFARGAEEKRLDVGTAPLIFVAHSMGGLVVKKAVILGQNDTHYKDIVQSITAIVFLSTPHRGTNLADILNKILSACLFSLSPKQYIAELKNNSPTIQEINEQFRNLVDKIKIVSFFETQATSVGPTSMLILHRDSSTLGYPGEISKPLNANHHDVCKYINRQDPNYTSVRDILIHLVEEAAPLAAPQTILDAEVEMEMIANFVGNAEMPRDDHEFFSDKRLDGSCEWLLEDPTLTMWSDSAEPRPQVLWCTGKPGSGKSVAASFLIGTFEDQNLPCAFYYFRFGDQLKNSLSLFLLSIAFQIAVLIPEYRRRLIRMYEDGLNVQKAAPRLIWQKLFVSALFKVNLTHPLFIVVDGLDESESAPVLLKLLVDLADAKIPLRLLLVSRPTQAMSNGIERLSKRVTVTQMTLDNTAEDLRLYVAEEMDSMHGEDAFKEQIIARILDKADGNFLWVHLVVNEILQCHTEDEVIEALNQVPQDLEPLYERMDETLAKSSKPGDQALGRTILMWAACSRYPLTLTELSGALLPEYPRVLDLKYTTQQVCGEFVVIDKKMHVTMMHSSAREYLMTNYALHYHIEFEKAHQTMFSKCLATIMTSNLKGKLDVAQGQSFLFYAATSWPFHLEASSSWLDQESLALLARFFRHQSVLNWIFILASTGRLRTLVHAAKAMGAFIRISDRLDKDRSPLTHRLQDKEILSAWAHDLVRLVGKFGGQLVKHPKTIWKMVPAFCPQQSIIRHQFLASNSPRSLTLKGSINPNWDDCLARFSVAGDSMPLKIITLDRHFAIVSADGVIRLYYSATCEEARSFHNGERVLVTCFSSSGDKMATYGFLKTKVWDTRTARQLCSIENPTTTKALAMTFGDNDATLLTCSDDRWIRVCTLDAPQYGWERLEEPLGLGLSQSANVNSPRKAKFNHDGTLIAVAYRGCHPSVWSISESGPRFVRQCERRVDRALGTSIVQTGHTDAQAFCWNPISGHILGIFNDGCVFKWHPIDDDYELSSIRATNITCSADGKFFVTGSGNGMLRIWDFYHFSPVYQLTYAASVTDLAIDRNESRIYDIRENFCNIWEPNALFRLLETDEKASDALSTRESSTQVSLVSEASFENAEPITALAFNAFTSNYAVGDDGGAILVFDCDGNRQAELSERFMTIEQVCWSGRGEFIASADLSRSIMVEQLIDVDEKNHTKHVSTVLLVNEKDHIQQLLMDLDGSLLLVATNRQLKLWSIERKAVISTLPEKGQYVWVNWPTDPSSVLGCGLTSLRIMRWHDELRFHEIPLDTSELDAVSDGGPNRSNKLRRRQSGAYPMSPTEIETQVDKVLLSPKGELVLVQSSEATFQGRRERECMLIDLTSMDDLYATKQAQAKPLPPELRLELEMPLGFVTSPLAALPHSRQSSVHSPREAAFSPTLWRSSNCLLVFVSKDFWICSFNLGPGQPGRVRRHFFLPRDWWNMDLLELATVTPDGQILCPRNGEVGIIANGLIEEWAD